MTMIEPSVNDYLKFNTFVKKLENLDRDALYEVSVELAKLALLSQPAAMRWAATEAAKNLTAQM